MTESQFNTVKNDLRSLCDAIMKDKRPEYTERALDVFYNFNTTAAELGLTREQILFVHMRKHLSSIAQYCAGNYNSSEAIEKRIADAINYLTILYAMHVEPILEDTPV